MLDCCTLRCLSILCRDGVSDGQFYQVLLYELDAIRKVYMQIMSLLIYNFSSVCLCKFTHTSRYTGLCIS